MREVFDSVMCVLMITIGRFLGVSLRRSDGRTFKKRRGGDVISRNDRRMLSQRLRDVFLLHVFQRL